MCSAGIGRTGTYIGLHYLIDQAAEEGRVDVLRAVHIMRSNRVNMIQTCVGVFCISFTYCLLFCVSCSGVVCVLFAPWLEVVCVCCSGSVCGFVPCALVQYVILCPCLEAVCGSVPRVLEQCVVLCLLLWSGMWFFATCLEVVCGFVPRV